MLLKRVITALILAPLIILAVFKLSPENFSLLWGAVILLAAWEWAELSELQSRLGKIVYLVLFLLPMSVIYFWMEFLGFWSEFFKMPEIYEFSGILDWFAIGPIVWWVLVMILIRNVAESLMKLKIKPGVNLFLGWFILFSAWMFLGRLRSFHEPDMTLYFFLLIWAADISAYFAGKKFGKVKLSPEISPGKTVAGMYGALVAAVVCSVILGIYYGFTFMSASDFVLLSLLTVLISIYGDLFF
ncbi:MAG: phosphatidate cytidylyltransferase, partial [Gammaproteobacteria bacterium]